MYIYDPTRFDQETDEASEDDSDNSDTTSDSDSEEEEMRLIPKKEKKKKKKTDSKTKEQKAKDQVPTTVTPPSRCHVHFPQDKTDEIADLIDNLGKMSIHDSNYRSMYFKVITFAPHMGPFLKSPPRNQDGSTPDANPSASTPPP